MPGRTDLCESCLFFDPEDQRAKPTEGMPIGRNMADPPYETLKSGELPPIDGVCHFPVTAEQQPTSSKGWCSNHKPETAQPE